MMCRNRICSKLLGLFFAQILFVGAPAMAGQMGHCVFGSIVAEETLKTDNISIAIMGQRDASAFASDWIFVDESGAYQFCGLSDGLYKMILSPAPNASIVFELPFNIQGESLSQNLVMERLGNRLNFRLEGQTQMTTLLSHSRTARDNLRMPLGAHVNSWGRYLPGLVQSHLSPHAPVVLGAMPRTVGYNYHGIDWRNPVQGGPLTPLDISGVAKTRWSLGGLDASKAYGGGAQIEWLRGPLSDDLNATVGIQWQPQDTLFLPELANQSFGNTSAAFTLSTPLVARKLWVNVDAHFRDNLNAWLGDVPHTQQSQGGILKGDLLWRPSSKQATDLAVYWRPNSSWYTHQTLNDEMTQMENEQGLGVRLRNETQLADLVSWENRIAYHRNSTTRASERCPAGNCNDLHLPDTGATISGLPGWENDHRWSRLDAGTDLNVTVPLLHWRWPVKAGLQFQSLEYAHESRLPGILTTYQQDEPSLQLSSPAGDALTGTQTLFAWYLSAHFRINSYLTFLPGVRWDRMSWSASDGNQVVSDGVAPRMGFKAYPMKSNDFEVRGGFFQYNDTGTLDLFTQSFRPSDLNVASWDEGSGTWQSMGDNLSQNRMLTVTDNLLLPKLNEALGGVRMGDDQLRGSLDLVYRQTDNIYAFYESNLQRSGGTERIVGSGDGTADSHLLLATYAGAFRTYWGFHLGVEGMIQDGLPWGASYTLGNLEGTVADYFDDRGQNFSNFDFDYGALEFDVRHQLNLHYTAALRPGLSLSQIWHYQTGAPIMRTQEGETVRLADQFLLQTRMLWQPPVENKNAVAFYVDVLNLFNANADAFLHSLASENETVVADPFADPLRVQLGMRYGF